MPPRIDDERRVFRMSGSGQLERWVYVSQSTLLDAEAKAGVAEIVRISRERNRRLNVTGGLIFTGQRFAQLLEGPPASIDLVKGSILADRRHRLVTTVCVRMCGRRQFEGWSLVYSGEARYISALLDEVPLGAAPPPILATNAITTMFREFARDSNIVEFAPRIQDANCTCAGKRGQHV